MLKGIRQLAIVVFAAIVAFAAHASADIKAKEQERSKDLKFERLDTTYRYENDGRGEIIQGARIRVLTEAGRDAIGQFYFSYASELEDIKIDYFRTIKKDGTVLAVDPALAINMASPVSQAAPMFSDLKLKVMVAKDLAVGDALEYQFTRVVQVPLKAGDFWALHYQNRMNMVDSETVTLDVPSDRKLALKTDPGSPPKIKKKDGRKIYRWELSNPKPREASGVPDDPLFVASTLTDWKQIGDWYLGLEAGRVEPTPELKQLAGQLTAGKTTPREKVDALYTYVSEQVRYVALEFGIGGYQPHPALDVLRNRYGDCKDKTGLLQALLAAAGIPAYPALLNATRGVIEPTVPMPGQFNHVITVVPMDGQLLWMDPTIGVAPLGVLAVQIRGRQALLVQPGASRLADIPEHSPVPERSTVTISGKLDATGKLTLSDEFVLRGIGEVLFRTLFRLGNQQALSTLTKGLAQSQAPGATAGEPTNSDPLDLTKPFSVKLEVTDSGFFPPLEKSEQVRVPATGADTFNWATEVEHARKEVEEADKTPGAKLPDDINLAAVGTSNSTLDLDIDPSYQVDLPLPVHADRPFGSYDSSYSFDHGHLKVRRVLVAKVDKLPARQWQDLETFQNIVESDFAQTLQLRRAAPINLEEKTAGMSAEELEREGNRALDQGNAFLARTLFTELTKKEADSKTAWNNLGRADLALGLLDEAEQALKTQITVHPNDEYAYNNLGQVYAGRRQYDKAIEQYQKQLAISPLDRFAYPNLAQAYAVLDRWADAAEAWSKAVSIDHDNALYYTEWGHALLKAGKTEEGRGEMKRALEIDRSALTLNNVAYDLAEAGVDLDQAEEDAQAAVGQAAASLNDTNSLEVPKDYNGRLWSLSAYLDTLGWVYFTEGQYDRARPLLSAAYEMRAQSDIAEHLAQLNARQNRPDDALRFYAWSMLEPGWTGRTPSELKQYLEQHLGGAEGLLRKVAEVDNGYYSQHRLSPDATRVWPAGAAAAKQVMVQLQALVDEKGKVSDLQALSGDEPFRTAALGDARALTLPPLDWAGQRLKTLRTLTYLYSPDKKVTAVWSFGKTDENSLQAFNTAEGSVFAPGLLLLSTGQVDQGIAAVREVLRTRANSPYAEHAHLALGRALSTRRDYSGAVAEFRAAVRLSPDDPQAHRVLADTLALMGDHAAASAEYQQALRLNPDDADAHFTLGAQFEAAAANAALKGHHYDPSTPRAGLAATKLSKAALDNYRAAFEQYRLAHQLAPNLQSYTEAYQRLAQQLGEKQ